MAPTDVGARAEPEPSQQVPVLLTLPEPTGTEAVGVVDLHLVDASRLDPYSPADPRELMVSIWYPATDVAGVPVRPWLSPGVAQVYADSLIQVGASPEKRWAWAPGHGGVGAAAEVSGGRRPVVVFSPGSGMPRELSTAQAEDLAGHGFVVVTMSHTYDSSATEFPGGRVEQRLLPPAADPGAAEAQILTALATRVADTRFVLDKLVDIAAGNNPDADRHPLPANLPRVLDVSKIVMFGHSLGGATAAQAMHDDPRIAAAADLDGRLWGSVVTEGLDRPFMLISGDGEDRDDFPGWQQLRATGHGPKFHFRLNGAQHHSFCDNQLIAAPLVTANLMPSGVASQVVGTVDPHVSLELQNGYLRSFFNTALGRYDQLTQAPATLLHPEMVPVP
ncbi:alpha/beta hydrolase family protein [Nocardia sp. NBC_00416]|uniref:alpha/beta hydrolase family protein n=1 Tax=Nocardia sp. NBC_00416 TaxID=2975991 RepID=UPI002E210E4D